MRPSRKIEYLSDGTAMETIVNYHVRDQGGQGHVYQCPQRYFDFMETAQSDWPDCKCKEYWTAPPVEDKLDPVVVAIRMSRFDRGKAEALAGEPPTESSQEYQDGYYSVAIHRGGYR